MKGKLNGENRNDDYDNILEQLKIETGSTSNTADIDSDKLTTRQVNTTTSATIMRELSAATKTNRPVSHNTK